MDNQPKIEQYLGGVNTADAGMNSALLLIERLPKFEYQITSFNFPSLTGEPVRFNTPPMIGQFKATPVKYEWGDISVTSKISESYDNYFAIFTWMWENLTELYLKDANSEGSIIILNNQKKIINRISLIQMFPVTLDEVRIDMSNAEPATFTTRFKIEMFQVFDGSGKALTPTIKGNL